jgi:hypothetical protein
MLPGVVDSQPSLVGSRRSISLLVKGDLHRAA